jgi:plasmid maintenance system antidote protein VapI
MKRVTLKRPDSESETYPSIRAAAEAIGVTEARLAAWLSSAAPWPTPGRHLRRDVDHLVGLVGHYTDGQVGRPRRQAPAEIEIVYTGRHSGLTIEFMDGGVRAFSTQGEAAKELGVSQATISMLFRGGYAYSKVLYDKGVRVITR